MPKIINLKRTGAGHAEILLMGEIGWESEAESFINQLHALENDGVTSFTVRINSYGGDVFQGMTIYNALAEREATVIIEGIAASIASVIALAGKRVEMQKNGFLMIHNPATLAFGDQNDMEAAREQLDRVKQTIMDIYTAKTGQSAADISAMMDRETWLTADAALEAGFVDAVIEPPKRETIFNHITQFLNKGKGEQMHKIFAMLSRLSGKAITNEAEAESALQALESDSLNRKGELETARARVEELEQENGQLRETVESYENAEADRLKEEAEAVVNAAIDSGAILEDEREVWMNQLTSDFAGAKEVLEKITRPKMKAPGENHAVRTPEQKKGGTPVTALAQAIREQMGA